MDDRPIAAEVIPQPSKSREAALALQSRGFKVLHLGSTGISVSGPAAIWQQHFSLTFHQRAKAQLPAAHGGETTYAWPDQDPTPIPSELDGLIASVAFVEPPEFFRSEVAVPSTPSNQEN